MFHIIDIYTGVSLLLYKFVVLQLM